MKKVFFFSFVCVLIGLCAWSAPTMAGNQKEEPLANSVKALMQKSVSDLAAPRLLFDNVAVLSQDKMEESPGSIGQGAR